MIKDTYTKIRYAIAALPAILLLYSCATIGNPSGGPRDEDPPRFVRASPEPGSVDVMPKRIVLDFNELINVKDVMTKVVVSPPSARTPRVTSQGRRVTVMFQDSLLPNTTYTIDFADAIEDNNEGNKLQGFSYSFSTGAEIDTMMVSGIVLSARDLEPQQGILVGVHESNVDTAFTTTPFLRVARTDDRGRFVIRGLPQKSFKIFALNDLDNDFKYANPEEDLAFLNAPFITTVRQEETKDTIYNLKTGAIDTVLTRMRDLYLPNDVLLRTFNVDRKQQYITNYTRVDSTRFSLIFNSKSSTRPLFTLVGDSLKDAFVEERNARNDTITLWLRDPKLIKTDTLTLAARYQRLDSALNYIDYTDTLRFITNRPKPPKKKSKIDNAKKIVTNAGAMQDSIKKITTSLNVLSNSTMDINVPLLFELEAPPEKFDTTAFRLLQKSDSVYVPVKKPYRLLAADSVSIRRYKIEYPWEYGKSYRLEADTMAIVSIYGKPTRPLTHDFTMKEEKDYSALTFNISEYDFGDHAFVELLTTSDAVVRREPVVDNVAYFPFLAPGKYYARIIEDFNGNGEYDTGDYAENLQPDLAYYYPKQITLKQNWDRTESWNVYETAVDLQKPYALKKNKPATTKGRKENVPTEEEEDELFDPMRNPFDPNDKGSRAKNNGMNRR